MAMRVSDPDSRMCAAIASLLRNHSRKYGQAEATDNSVVISTEDGTVSLVVTRMGLAGQEMVQVDAEELHDLRQEAGKLRALEAAGVDNWSGYQTAMEIYRDGE